MFRSARLLLCCLLALVAVLPLSAAQARARKATACIGVNDLPTPATVETARSATLCLLNNERTSRGRRPLRANLKLQRAADTHSVDMARRNYFDHTSPNGATVADRIQNAGYNLLGVTYIVAENIAWGQMELATPKSIMNMWMHSPGSPQQHPQRQVQGNRHRHRRRHTDRERQRRDVHDRLRSP